MSEQQYRRKPPIPKRPSARPPADKPSQLAPLAPPLGIEVAGQPVPFTSQPLPVGRLPTETSPAGVAPERSPTVASPEPSPVVAAPKPPPKPAAPFADSAPAAPEAEPSTAPAKAPSEALATLPSPVSATAPSTADPDSTSTPGATARPAASQQAVFRTDELWSGKLRVTGEIDRGGMSYIMRGTDTTLRRELALKVSPMPRKQLPGDQLARFIEEAQITAQLEHPNVVPVHELGLDADGRMYFSMKLVRGQSLESILEGRRAKDPTTLAEFGLRRLLDVFLQVCQAIEYAHARGVIHRDLKPGNIMVGDFGEVLVMDWGVAKVVGKGGISLLAPTTNWDSEAPGSRPSQPPESVRPGLDVSSFRAGKQAFATQSGTLIGTPAYMSPEQAQGRAVDERADLYALGVILYEILCGELPFDDDDPSRLIVKKLHEQPKRPSAINRAAPLALETLALRLLAKERERRTLTIPQIRTHVQNYIEGIARDYRQENLWSNALWILGGLGLFAFLVWYLTGQSIASRFVMTPATVFNAAGWFLLVVALKSPLWAQYLAIRPRLEPDRFRPPTADELFVAGYLANRTFAAALAPIFQLVFIVEIVSIAVAQASRGQALSSDFAQRITNQLRGEWAQSLIVILIFLFLYLFFMSAEVRFARQIDRYELLIGRPRWEAEWPFFLIILLLLTIGATDVLDWALAPGRSDLLSFLRQQVLTQPLDLVEIAKTLVFQGTFLLGFVVVTVVLSFRFAEVLAALRLAYQPADEASVANRAQYFLRSVAIFRVARVNWLYGGAMVGGLTAMTVLSQLSGAPLVKQVLYILGPSLIGFIGYGVTRRHLQTFLEHAPAVRRLLEDSVDRSEFEQSRVAAEKLAGSSLRYRIAQLGLPLLVIVLYLIWTGSGLHQHAIQQLVMPVTTKGWLLILPYVLVIPVLLFRDRVELWLLRRRVARQSQTENV